jgi:hypothetical protein
VSTFYLLPPRPLAGDAVARFFHTLFPGLDWDSSARAALADAAAALAGSRPGFFVVFRDDLPHGEPPARALVDGFGAEPGDEVVEVLPAAAAGELTSRRWRLPGRAAA